MTAITTTTTSKEKPAPYTKVPPGFASIFTSSPLLSPSIAMTSLYPHASHINETVPDLSAGPWSCLTRSPGSVAHPSNLTCPQLVYVPHPAHLLLAFHSPFQSITLHSPSYLRQELEGRVPCTVRPLHMNELCSENTFVSPTKLA